MRPEFKGFTEHALDRFIERSKTNKSRAASMKYLMELLDKAYIVKKSRRKGEIYEKGPFQFVVKKGIVRTVLIRKLTPIEVFAMEGPRGIS